MNSSQQDLIQPLEQYACVLWNEDVAVAYLCGDGKTVRPIPGKEDHFADFCKRVGEENPAEAKKFIFEGPKPKGKKSRGRKKKDDNDS